MNFIWKKTLSTVKWPYTWKLGSLLGLSLVTIVFQVPLLILDQRWSHNSHFIHLLKDCFLQLVSNPHSSEIQPPKKLDNRSTPTHPATLQFICNSYCNKKLSGKRGRISFFHKIGKLTYNWIKKYGEIVLCQIGHVIIFTVKEKWFVTAAEAGKACFHDNLADFHGFL